MQNPFKPRKQEVLLNRAGRRALAAVARKRKKGPNFTKPKKRK